MVPQVHFNFGPTSFDRFYQLSLPLIPGGVFTGGALIAKPNLGIWFRSAFTFHSYAGMAAFIFAAYLAGSVFFTLSAILTGIVSAIAQGVAFRSWTPLRASWSLSKCTIWRQVATRFLGELAPALPDSSPTASVMEKIQAPMTNLANKTQHDQLWEEWYRVLQDYLLRDTPLISNDVMVVWLAGQATAWAFLALSFVTPHARHWPVYVLSAIVILIGTMFPFLVTLNYLQSERLSYWDFTARLLAEIRARGLLPDAAEKPKSQ